MKKFSNDNLKNIQTIFEEKTGVGITRNRTYVNQKYVLAFAAMLLCFVTFSAFAYAKFSDLDGDRAAFYPNYKGDGIFEITITNASDRDLVLQEQIKLKRWSTSEEIEGDKEKILFSNMTIEAGSQGTIVIDLSEAYDIEALEQPLPEKDHYYLVLTNNDFAFGQDWMCSISFDESVVYEVPDEEEFIAEVKEENVYEAPLAYEAWCWPTESKNISNLYGEGKNGVFSDHINIAGEQGDKVYAVAAGTVVETGFEGTIGNYILLDVGEGISIKYGHLKKVSVEEGDEVKAGEKIGKMGQTGMATGPNLYFAVYVGDEAVNPLAE